MEAFIAKTEGPCQIVRNERVMVYPPNPHDTDDFFIVHPAVALNSALGFIKPLTIEAQPLKQRNPLDHPNSEL
jgi:hypothetical protein